MRKGNRLIVHFILGLFLSLGLAGPLLAQAPVNESSSRPPVPRALKKVIVEGKIRNLQSMGGYYIQKRGEIYKIANKNPQVLEKLAQSGKMVTIEARSQGDLLTIEKIDGEAYPEYTPPGAR